jgi:dual specificity phosphatase 12
MQNLQVQYSISFFFIYLNYQFVARHVLAHNEDILYHKPGEDPDWKNLSWVRFALNSDDCRAETCRQAFFVIPPTWITANNAPQGKLNCPKCRSKIGAFSWNQSLKCPCSASFQPAFYFTPSRVDFIVNKWVAINFIEIPPTRITLV